MPVATLLAIASGINANMAALNELLKTVIGSQPPDVQKDMWERHMTLTQPAYDALVHILQKIDPAMINTAAPAAAPAAAAPAKPQPIVG